jgi:D-glycero-D-manno-heptose 1,7-bisphosphate phosphatase
MNRALFLDRDGVINEDYGYVHKIEDFHFREGIFDVCRAALTARMKIIVVTNRAGIGRGFYTEQDYLKVTEYMFMNFELSLETHLTRCRCTCERSK